MADQDYQQAGQPLDYIKPTRVPQEAWDRMDPDERRVYVQTYGTPPPQATTRQAPSMFERFVSYMMGRKPAPPAQPPQ